MKSFQCLLPLASCFFCNLHQYRFRVYNFLLCISGFSHQDLETGIGIAKQPRLSVVGKELPYSDSEFVEQRHHITDARFVPTVKTVFPNQGLNRHGADVQWRRLFLIRGSPFLLLRRFLLFPTWDLAHLFPNGYIKYKSFHQLSHSGLYLLHRTLYLQDTYRKARQQFLHWHDYYNRSRCGFVSRTCN